MEKTTRGLDARIAREVMGFVDCGPDYPSTMSNAFGVVASIEHYSPTKSASAAIDAAEKLAKERNCTFYLSFDKQGGNRYACWFVERECIPFPTKFGDTAAESICAAIEAMLDAKMPNET